MKSSVSRALAESYFWNFAFKVADIIKSFEDETVGIEYKDGDETKVGHLEPRKFLLFIPYNWDLDLNPVTVNQIGQAIGKSKKNAANGMLITKNG